MDEKIIIKLQRMKKQELVNIVAKLHSYFPQSINKFANVEL